MTKGTLIFIILTIVFIIIGVLISIITFMKKGRKKKYNSTLLELEREKNGVISSSLLSEFNKLESLKNSQKIKDKIEDWRNTFDKIQNKSIPLITDQILDI